MSVMTTEQKLRDALVGIMRYLCGGACDGMNEKCGECVAISKARVALAIPPSESREEFIVSFESLEYFPERWEATSLKYANREGALWVAVNRDRQPRFYRNVRVESHTISVSPLVAVALPAGKAVPAGKALPAEKE